VAGNDQAVRVNWLTACTMLVTAEIRKLRGSNIKKDVCIISF